MKDRYLILIAFIIAILQITVLQFISIANVVPNLALIVVIVFTIYLDEFKALKFSAYIALFLDVLSGKGLGVYLIAFIVISYTVDKIGATVFKDNFLSPIIFIAFSTVFLFVYFTLVDYFSVGFVHGFFWSLKVLIIEIAYNVLIGIPIYNFVISAPRKKRY